MNPRAQVPAAWTAPDLAAVPAPNPDPAALRSWLDAVSAVAAVVQVEASEGQTQQWYGERLADLMPHIEYLQHSGPDLFDILRRFVVELLQDPPRRKILQTVGVHQRVLLSLIADARRSDVLIVLADLQDNGRSYATVPTADGAGAVPLSAMPAYLLQLSDPVEPGVLKLGPVDLPLAAQLTRFAWTGDGILQLEGWAYLPGIDPADCVLDVGLRQQESNVLSALPVRRDQDPRVDIAAADRWQSYAGAAFAASVDVRTLPGLQQSAGAREWAVQMTLRAGELSVSDVVRVRDSDLVPRRFPVEKLVGERTRVIGIMDAVEGLRLKAVRYSCVVSSLELYGTMVRVGFDDSAGAVPAALYLDAPGEARLEVRRDGEGAGFAVDAASLTSAAPADGKEKRWTLQALLPNGRIEPVGWAGAGTDLAAASDPTAALRAECTGYGYLQISLRPQRVTLTRAELLPDGGTIGLEGCLGSMPGFSEPVLPELLLMTARNELRPLSTRWLDESGSFRAEFALLWDKWGHGESALEPGHYRVLRVLGDGTGGLQTVRVPALGKLLTDLPLQIQHELMSMELVGEGNEQDLVLRVAAPRTAADLTARSRSRAITAYSRTADAVDRSIALFETFDGKSCSDSGRAISDVLGVKLPGLRRYWTIADFSVSVPANCTPVLRESPEWFHLLATAGYLVNNNNFPHYFRKRPEQYYLQTWHGTPLKRIGADTPLTGTTASYRALITREAAAWDMLLTQNEFAAETLTAAFGYRGEPAVFGYPRNDALTADTAPVRRAETRRRLGIADSRKVLLYLPTWRDDGAVASPYLNFEAAAARLGPDYLLLYRGHHKIANRRKTTGQVHYVDVTVYPEINDLYLAADLLVTDYSSAIFDFCTTGKPMYFLAPDLEHYRDSERGFYFDFEEQVPGPVTTSTDELLSVILTNQVACEPYSGRYREFVHRYASDDDGAAADRVVQVVWGVGSTSSEVIADLPVPDLGGRSPDKKFTETVVASANGEQQKRW